MTFWTRTVPGMFPPHPALVDPIWSPWNAGALGAGVLLVALTALALHQRRRRPFLAVGWLWFVVMLLPMIGLVQVGEQSWAERYAYLPLIGIYLALVWSAAELWAARPAWRRPLVVAAGAALLACGLQTWVHTAFWRNSEALYRRALAVTERNYMAHIGLANTLARAGDRAGARREYEAAFAIRDDFPTLLFDLGLFHQDEGDLARALELYERALALYPQYLVARLNLAAVRHRMGDLDGALAESELLLAQKPDQPDANYNAALVLAQRDDLERAHEHLLRAVRARPDFSQARQLLGRIEEAAGRRAEALRHLRIACSSEPLPAEAATWLAWILSTAPENELRDGVEALGWADRAVAATGGRDPAALEARAAALAQLRRFDEAAAVQERAVDLAPPGARAELLERLELYRRRKPFRTER